MGNKSHLVYLRISLPQRLTNEIVWHRLFQEKAGGARLTLKQIVSCEYAWFPWRHCIIARKPASFAHGKVETTTEEVSNIVQRKMSLN